MRKAILGGVLTVAALVVILTMQGVSLHGMLGDDDDDDDNPGALRALFHLDEFATLTGSAASPAPILTEDSSGYGNNGNLIDGVTVLNDGGKFDDALSFNGVGGFVEVGRDPTMEPA